MYVAKTPVKGAESRGFATFCSILNARFYKIGRVASVTLFCAIDKNLILSSPNRILFDHSTTYEQDLNKYSTLFS